MTVALQQQHKISVIRPLLISLGLIFTCSLANPVLAQPADMLWSCTSINDGKEWQCQENPDYVEPSISTTTPAAQPEQTSELTATASTEPTTSPEPSPQQEPATNTETANVETAVDNTATKPDFTPTAPVATSVATAKEKESEPETVTAKCSEDNTEACLGRSKLTKPTLQQSQQYTQLYPSAYASAQETSTLSRREFAPREGSNWHCQADESGANWRCGEAPVQEARIITRTYSINASSQPYAFLDWHAYANGKADPTTHCAGQYIQPEFAEHQEDANQEDQPTRIRADKTRTTNNNFTTLSGNIVLEQGDNQLRSQRATVDHDKELAQFEGHVLYRQPGSLMLAETADFDQPAGSTTLDQVQFVFHDNNVRGEAERVVQLDNEDVYITSGRYTRCEPGNEDWILSGSEIILYQREGYGIARNATLRVGGVPVFYLPYFHFPIDDRRKSGFLFPSAGYTKDNGFDISAPYYFNIAPNMDDTLTPRLISERGLLLENQFRYLHESGQYEFSLAYLPNDNLYDNDRWLLGIDHQGSPIANVETFIDYTAVSDNDYFDDLSTNLNIAKETHLDKLARIRYQGDSWQATAKLQSYQTITSADKPYQELPELTFSGDEYFQDNRYRLSYLADFTEFDRDNSAFTGILATTGQRLHLQSTLSTVYTWPWAFVRPRLTLTHTSYNLEDQPVTTEESPSRTLPIFSIDSGLYFDRPMQWGDSSYTHTLEPRLFYLNVPYEDQSKLPYFDSSELAFSYSQLFRENRFSGYDRIGDANQITLGLTSRILEEDGGELMHVSVGQIFYLDDRQVRLTDGSPALTDSNSNFAAEGLWQVSKHMRFTADGEWENNDFNSVKRNLKLSYRSDLNHQFNLGYRFTKDDIEQADASLIWPINGNWSLLARWLHDIEGSETLDRIIGLEYENCCWRLRTLLRSWIDDDADDRENNGIFLQFTLKGLGTAGTRAGGDAGPSARDFLGDITGFEERELYDQ